MAYDFPGCCLNRNVLDANIRECSWIFINTTTLVLSFFDYFFVESREFIVAPGGVKFSNFGPNKKICIKDFFNYCHFLCCFSFFRVKNKKNYEIFTKYNLRLPKFNIRNSVFSETVEGRLTAEFKKKFKKF
jgi:hypothetical protein